MQNKYDNKIIPYENKDDEYASKAGGLYSKYTSTWEYIKESIKDSVVDTVDMIKGLLKSVADLVVGVFGLIKGIAIYAAAGVAIDIKEVTGEVPDWMQYCIDKSDEYNNTILEVLKDPGLIIEGLSQSVSNAYEEKGISYASGYIAGEVVQTILISKGLGKLKGISKVDEAITKVEDLSKTAEDISGIAGNAGESYLSPEMEQKILEGYRFPGKNKIKGGHSPNVITNDSNYYSVEVISENPDGTKYVGYYRQFSDGKISTYKKSTIFPESWSDEKIISSVKEISNTKPVGSRTGEDGITTTLHSGVIDGVKIDVIKEGNVITSGYPEGGKPTPGFEPIN